MSASAVKLYATTFTQVTLIVFLQLTEGKVFSLCELAQELHYNHSYPLDELAMWLCIAYYESKYNSSAVGPHKEDYGIFQISKLYWCDPEDSRSSNQDATLTGGFNIKFPNVCNVSCSNFLDDDIADDVKCSQTIYSQHKRFEGDGFKAWAVYPTCQRQWPLIPEWCFSDGVIPRHLSSKAFD